MSYFAELVVGSSEGTRSDWEKPGGPNSDILGLSSKLLDNPSWLFLFCFSVKSVYWLKATVHWHMGTINSNIWILSEVPYTIQEQKGFIAHLGTQFKSINAMIITLIRQGKNHYLFFENWMVLICKTLKSLHPICATFGWNWRRRFINFNNLF